MAIAMIVVGVVLTAVGVIILSKGNNDGKSEPQVVTARSSSPSASESTAKAKTQATEDDAKVKGSNFEAYVVDLLKGDNKFRILEWNQGTTTPDGNFAENELNPDLKVALPRDGGDITFWMECKYRTWIDDAGFVVPKYQLDRYRQHQGKTHLKVLIVLGAGGDSKAPKNLFIIPVDSMQANKPLTFRELQPYKIVNHRHNIESSIRDYFINEVFAKARKN